MSDFSEDPPKRKRRKQKPKLQAPVLKSYDDAPVAVKNAVEKLIAELAGDTYRCGNTKIVGGYLLESHTLGCRNQANDPEEEWEERHDEILREYEEDEYSLVVYLADEISFITITPLVK